MNETSQTRLAPWTPGGRAVHIRTMEVRVKKGASALAWLLVLALAACSTGTAATGAAAGQTASSTAVEVSSSSSSSQWGILSTSYTGALPIPAQLAIGTMQLEGTENVVAAEQAGQLLTLWQGYASLLAGDTSAEAEYQGLQHQIEESMTSAQLQAIAGLQLTTSDMSSALGAMGGGPSDAMNSRRTRSAGTSSSSSSTSQRSSGAGFSGGPPGGGEMMIVGGPPGGLTSTQTANTAASAPVTTQASGEINSGLVQAIIEYLQGKLGTSTAN